MFVAPIVVDMSSLFFQPSFRLMVDHQFSEFLRIIQKRRN